jgi:hypothetical protein
MALSLVSYAVALIALLGRRPKILGLILASLLAAVAGGWTWDGSWLA